MKCSFCKQDKECSEVFKWPGEKLQEEPELVCNDCGDEMWFIRKVKNLTEEELAEIRSKRTPCEIYSRVVGYIRPVNQWNEGKQTEFKDRKNFNVSTTQGE